MKKGMIGIILAVLAAVVLTTIGIYLFGGEPLNKVISNKGYEISVKKDWTAGADGTLSDESGAVVGKYVLVYDAPDLSNIAAYAGVAVTKTVDTVDFSKDIIKNRLETENGPAVQYFVKDLPNPEPYAASIVLYTNAVDENTCDRIAKSFSYPAIGANPPKKNISAPQYDEIADGKVARFIGANGDVEIKNVSLIDTFIKRQTAKESTGLDVLCYEETIDGSVVLASWVHIESDGGKGYLYSYYDRADGVYTYDNNPLVFEGITKDILEEENITAYSLKLGETQTTRLLEIPLNLYRDNADDLILLKSAESGNKQIMDILRKMKGARWLEGVTVEKNGGDVVLKLSNENMGWKTLVKDAAVIFSLCEDVTSVKVENADGTSYTVTREEVFSAVKTSPEKATQSADNFVKFTEEVEKIEPEALEGDDANVADGTVIYSTTVVISENTMVTHPRTGKRVAVGPYARKNGYGQYLGKAITCTVKKSGSGYVATATCGGRVLASYSLGSRAAADNFIATVKAYS